jgi:hypothetical protein
MNTKPGSDVLNEWKNLPRNSIVTPCLPCAAVYAV